MKQRATTISMNDDNGEGLVVIKFLSSFSFLVIFVLTLIFCGVLNCFIEQRRDAYYERKKKARMS